MERGLVVSARGSLLVAARAALPPALVVGLVVAPAAELAVEVAEDFLVAGVVVVEPEVELGVALVAVPAVPTALAVLAVPAVFVALVAPVAPAGPAGPAGLAGLAGPAGPVALVAAPAAALVAAAVYFAETPASLSSGSAKSEPIYYAPSDTLCYSWGVNSRFPRSCEQAGHVKLSVARPGEGVSELDRFESVRAAAVVVVEQLLQPVVSGSVLGSASGFGSGPGSGFGPGFGSPGQQHPECW